MAWRQTILHKLADWVRFIIGSTFMVNAIMAALASVYFIAKFLWYSLQFFDRTIFKSPW